MDLYSKTKCNAYCSKQLKTKICNAIQLKGSPQNIFFFFFNNVGDSNEASLLGLSKWSASRCCLPCLKYYKTHNRKKEKKKTKQVDKCTTLTMTGHKSLLPVLA